MGKHDIAGLCVIGAILLAAGDSDGWGWLLFIAAFLVL